MEGVLVEEEAVLGANVVLTAARGSSTSPAPGPVSLQGARAGAQRGDPRQRPKEFPAGTYKVPCALIIGQRTASTDQKTSLNQALRDFAVPV